MCRQKHGMQKFFFFLNFSQTTMFFEWCFKLLREALLLILVLEPEFAKEFVLSLYKSFAIKKKKQFFLENLFSLKEKTRTQ